MLTGKVFCHLRHTSNEYPWTDKNEKVSKKISGQKKVAQRENCSGVWCVHTVIVISLTVCIIL